MKVNLKLKRQPQVPVFAENLTPDAFAGKTLSEIEDLTLLEGSRKVRVGELFEVDVSGEPCEVKDVELDVFGELSKFRYVGKGMSDGALIIEGDAGFYVGEGMKGGSLTVKGSTLGWTGSAMAGGRIEIFGDGGDYLASPYWGSREGMSGGQIIVHGNVGRDAGRWMRGGSIEIKGDAEEFLGRYMQGGDILVHGNCAGRAGSGMKAGRIIILGRIPEILPSFTYSELRMKVKFAGEKISRSFYLYNGDLVEAGNGRLFVARWPNKHLNPEGEIFAEGLSVNKLTYPIVRQLLAEAEKLKLSVIKHSSGATIIDAGVNVEGCERAGVLIGLACLAGLAEIRVEKASYRRLRLPRIVQTVTVYPAVATMAAQFAG
jgi:formylmethanofuran dehydrogenase subunit C